MELFPAPEDQEQYRVLQMNENMPFRGAPVPEIRPPEGLPTVFPPIPNPKPDLLYGFGTRARTDQQRVSNGLVERTEGTPVWETSLSLSWGFFLAEIESQATGQNVFAATNQAAGGGSACTSAVDKLLGLASNMTPVLDNDARIPPNRTDSITFSLAMDAETASLFVHWLDKPQTFYMHRIRMFCLHRPSELGQLKSHVSKIIAWGISERLAEIRQALDSVYKASILAARKRPREDKPTAEAEAPII